MPAQNINNDWFGRSGFNVVNRQDFPEPITGTQWRDIVANDPDGMLFEAIGSLEELDTSFCYGMAEVKTAMMEAITTNTNRIPRTMHAFVRTLNTNLTGTGLTAGVSGDDPNGPLAAEIANPRKAAGVTTLTARIPLSDGQTVSVVFHAPGVETGKIQMDDTLVAFRFLLNKKDVTTAVAPMGGRDVSLKQVTLSLSNLAERNSGNFIERQATTKAAQEDLISIQEEAVKLAEEKDSLGEKLNDLEATEATTDERISFNQGLLDKQTAKNEELEAQRDALKTAAEEAMKKGNGNTGVQESDADMQAAPEDATLIEAEGEESTSGQNAKEQEFFYGLRARPAGVGAVPRDGFITSIAKDAIEANKTLYAKVSKVDAKYTRHGVAVYSQQLTDEQVYDYELFDFQKLEASRDEGDNTPEEIKPGASFSVGERTITIQEIDFDAEQLTVGSAGSVFGQIISFQQFEQQTGLTIPRREKLEDDGSPAFYRARIEQLQHDIDSYQGISPIPKDNMFRQQSDLRDRLADALGVQGITITDEMVKVYRDSSSKSEFSEYLHTKLAISKEMTWQLADRVDEESRKRSKGIFDAKPEQVFKRKIYGWIRSQLDQVKSDDNQYDSVSFLMGAGRVSISVDRFDPESTNFNIHLIYEDDTGNYEWSDKTYPLEAEMMLESIKGAFSQVLKDATDFAEPFRTQTDTSSLPGYGSKLEETGGMSTKELAAKIRKDLKVAQNKGKIPKIKTGITSSHSKIDIIVKELPDSVPLYNPGYLKDHGNPEQFGRGTSRYSTEATAILNYLKAELNQYNYDKSDSMADYFNVRFYNNVTFDYKLENDRLKSEKEKALAPTEPQQSASGKTVPEPASEEYISDTTEAPAGKKNPTKATVGKLKRLLDKRSELREESSEAEQELTDSAYRTHDESGNVTDQRLLSSFEGKVSRIDKKLEANERNIENEFKLWHEKYNQEDWDGSLGDFIDGYGWEAMEEELGLEPMEGDQDPDNGMNSSEIEPEAVSEKDSLEPEKQDRSEQQQNNNKRDELLALIDEMGKNGLHNDDPDMFLKVLEDSVTKLNEIPGVNADDFYATQEAAAKLQQLLEAQVAANS